MTGYPLFIHGAFVETKTRQPVINPSDAEVIAEASVAGSAEVDAALAAAREAFDHGPWRDLSMAERKGYILALWQGILDKA